MIYDSRKKEYNLIDKQLLNSDINQDSKEYLEVYSANSIIYEGKEILVYAIGGCYFAWELYTIKNILNENLIINKEGEIEL